MRALQILVDGFAISTLYALGAIGFSLIFGVSGVLNLAHGGIMVAAAVAAWYIAGPLGAGQYVGALLGVGVGVVFAFATYGLVVRPIQRSRAIPDDETEIFVLTATLLWGIMIQEAIAYFFTDSPITVRPLINGVVDIFSAPLATRAGHTVTCLPSCHWIIRPETKSAPYFRPCGNSLSWP